MKNNRLRIWLLAEGEGLPVSNNARLMRMGMLAKYLSGQGHKVTWWSSTFLHGEKEYCYKKHKEILINENERLVLLHSPVSYQKNISLKRILYHQLLSKQFAKYSRKKNIPDIILCSWPIPQFAREAVAYGEREGVPVILDARDMWPDIYVRAFPKQFQAFADYLLIPMKRSSSKLFRSADGLTGITQAIVGWACQRAGREMGVTDCVIPIGNEIIKLSDEEFERALMWWQERKVDAGDWILCYIGTFGSHVDLDTVIKAVKKLSREKTDIKLVVAGDGDRKKEFINLAEKCPNIIFAGWIDHVQMSVLMKIAKAGALCIKDMFDFRDTFNNKAIQYLSGSLPIINSLPGYAKTLIEEKNMGISYLAENVENCMDCIERLYMNEKVRMVMAENGKRCFDEMFDLRKVNKQFEDYLIKMAQGKEQIKTK